MLLTMLVAASAASLPLPVETKITAASLFKNGYAVVLREAPFSGEGELLIADPPRAVLGTLWVTATDGVKISSVVATTVTSEVVSPLSSLEALLDANVGKKLVVFAYMPGHKEEDSFSGTLKSASGSMLVLDLDNGPRMAMQKSSVTRVSSVSGELVFEAKSTQTTNVLRVKGTGAGKVMVMSLERGMTWVPGYHVDITDPKKLTLTSKATIMNDLGNLEGVDLKLVTGFPNVRFINIFDPLTSMQSIDQFVNGMLAAGNVAMDASPMSQNAFAGRAGEGYRPGGFSAFDPGQLEGLQLEDLFFTTLPNVTLKNGERGYFVQFQESAAYEHVYTLDVPETGWSLVNYERGQQPQAEPPHYDVWHTLEFTNPSKFPLTTAAATTFKAGQVIGQDMLSYTTPNGKAVLRITKALDVQPDVLEEEVSRQVAALKATSYSRPYDLVSAKGTIQIVNYKSEAVKLKVSKSLVGEVGTVSNAGVVTKTSAGLRSVNPNSQIKWTVTLKPGEKVNLTYEFKVYVQTP